MRRVVITGIGAITPIGLDARTYWDQLVQGRSGVGPVTRFDASVLDTRIAAEVKGFDPESYMDRKVARRLDRFAQFAVAASRMALEDAGLELDGDIAERSGVLIGSGIGGIQTLEEQCIALVEKGAGRVSPFFVPMMIPDMGSGQVSIIFGAKAHNACTVTACASGTNSLGDAFKIIQRGDADIMITGGAEAAITRLAMAGFCAARTLSRRNDDPERASRPFDRDRDGFVLGEGSGILILEALDVAMSRGARIRAEVAGYGTSGDAYHITAPAPSGRGAAKAMANAIGDAKLTPGQIDYINAHGTATDLNDRLETLAIKQVFGEHAYRIPISSTKSMVGHLLGAAGGVEAIACVLALENGLLPPTTNLEAPDPDCDLDYVPNTARAAAIRVAMSNSFGFGGHNAVAVFKRFEP